MNQQTNYNRKTKIRGGNSVLFCQEVRENAIKALNDPHGMYVHRDTDRNVFYIDESPISEAHMNARKDFLMDAIRSIDAGLDPRTPSWEFGWAPYGQAMNGHNHSFAEGVAMLGYTKPAPKPPKVIEVRDDVGLTVDEYNARQRELKKEELKKQIKVPEEFKTIVK